MFVIIFQIDDMLNEVKFSKYVETGTYVTEIGLGDFIKRKLATKSTFFNIPSLERGAKISVK